MEWNFPMTMTIRCYGCGKVFDVVINDADSHDYPCPDCERIETFDLGVWAQKAIAWSEKMSRKMRRGR